MPSFWDKDLVVVEKNNPDPPRLRVFDSVKDICYLPDQATATHSFIVEQAEVQDAAIGDVDISAMDSATITTTIDGHVPDGYTGSRRRLADILQ